MRDYGIPYSYSPVIAANETLINDNLKAYKSFLEATKKGFLSCIQNPSEAIKILRDKLPDYDNNIDLDASLKMTSPHFGNEDSWGRMEQENLRRFLDWIKHKDLEKSDVKINELFTEICF